MQTAVVDIDLLNVGKSHHLRDQIRENQTSTYINFTTLTEYLLYKGCQ